MNFIITDCFYCELNCKYCICADVEEFFVVRASGVRRKELPECLTEQT